MSLSLGPHPHGERPSQPTTRASETLRDQLRELEREARLLGNDKSQLEHRLEILHQQIAVSDSKIRAKMEELDRLLGDEQAGEKQLAFEDSVLKDDKIVEALRGEMKKHNVLRIALHAMANGRGTVPHINVLSLALMNQLTRETRLFLSQLAVRVLEYDATHSDEPGVISTPIEIMSEDAAGMAPLPSPPPPSPRVKSEVRSVSTPTRLLQHVPTVATPEMYAPAFSSPVGTGDDPIGMSRLEDQFPGLLASLRASATSQPSNTNTPKRTRQSIESNDSSPSPASPAGKQQAKKAKLEKEPALSPTFVQFLKKVQDLHQQGKSIHTHLECSKCHQQKRDSRLLSCLHLYCHRCILALRAAAEKGHPVHGFRAFCVYPSCNSVVSGKTSVLDAEIIQFLVWYDTQPPDVKTWPAQMQVFRNALDKSPDDADIKNKAKAVQLENQASRQKGVADTVCDVLQMAKLARKPY